MLREPGRCQARRKQHTVQGRHLVGGAGHCTRCCLHTRKLHYKEAPRWLSPPFRAWPRDTSQPVQGAGLFPWVDGAPVVLPAVLPPPMMTWWPPPMLSLPSAPPPPEKLPPPPAQRSLMLDCRWMPPLLLRCLRCRSWRRQCRPSQPKKLALPRLLVSFSLHERRVLCSQKIKKTGPVLYTKCTQKLSP